MANDTLIEDTLVEEAKELFKPCSESAVLRDVAVFTLVIWECASADCRQD